MTLTHEPSVRLFPLTGTLLLPGTYLPLNVFEPRYRRLVEDTLATDRRIGMIQPFVPAADNFGIVADGDPQPPLYDVGCVGSVVECDPQPDGRYWIVLRGESRFRVVRELPLDPAGYRCVVADSSPYAADLGELEAEVDVGRLLATAARFCEVRQLEFDIGLLASLPPAQAINALCAALPFEPAEKQALLEAAGPQARSDLLSGLLDMQVTAQGPEPPAAFPPPVVN